MQLTFKDIVLKRIDFDDIEMIRNWRNKASVAQNMFFQEPISKEMQKTWFQNLSTENDFYFIIVFKEEKIGLINLKNINWKKKKGESGLFIAIEKFKNTPLAVYASLSFLNYFFEEKKLEKISASVKEENINTIAYNRSLGFEKEAKYAYVLTKEKYFNFTKKIYEKIA